MVEIFTDANFEEKVLKSEKPVLVDFYADWCGPCKMMAPVVDKMAEKYADQIVVGKLNVDDNMDTARAYRVRSIPYMAVFKNGEVANSLLGAGGEAALEDVLKSVL
ncbi:MAG: thioredoxin [Lachnospiraceae bacterium]|nr:thioredoxin [Lachnospiraceae bacterium]